MKRFSFLVIIALLGFSCAEKETKTIWVYPYRLNGILTPYVEPGKYLLYQESEELDYSSWEIIPTENYEILGLNFEEGFFYHLLVEQEENTPSQRWKLKSILETKKDQITTIEGSWQNVPSPGETFFPIVIRVDRLSRTLNIYEGCFAGITGLGEVSDKKVELVQKYYSLNANDICLAQNPPTSGGFSFVESTSEYRLTQEGFLEFFDAQENLLVRFQKSE